jgi:glycosyltransferase involved in cell wall biosynthesis
LLVSPDDEAELAAAMEQIWHDAALRERLRGEALAQAARFSWQQTAQATAEVYAAVHAKG